MNEDKDFDLTIWEGAHSGIGRSAVWSNNKILPDEQFRQKIFKDGYAKRFGQWNRVFINPNPIKEIPERENEGNIYIFGPEYTRYDNGFTGTYYGTLYSVTGKVVYNLTTNRFTSSFEETENIVVSDSICSRRISEDEEHIGEALIDIRQALTFLYGLSYTNIQSNVIYNGLSVLPRAFPRIKRYEYQSLTKSSFDQTTIFKRNTEYYSKPVTEMYETPRQNLTDLTYSLVAVAEQLGKDPVDCNCGLCNIQEDVVNALGSNPGLLQKNISAYNFMLCSIDDPDKIVANVADNQYFNLKEFNENPPPYIPREISDTAQVRFSIQFGKGQGEIAEDEYDSDTLYIYFTPSYYLGYYYYSSGSSYIWDYYAKSTLGENFDFTKHDYDWRLWYNSTATFLGLNLKYIILSTEAKKLNDIYFGYKGDTNEAIMLKEYVKDNDYGYYSYFNMYDYSIDISNYKWYELKYEMIKNIKTKRPKITLTCNVKTYDPEKLTEHACAGQNYSNASPMGGLYSYEQGAGTSQNLPLWTDVSTGWSIGKYGYCPHREYHFTDGSKSENELDCPPGEKVAYVSGCLFAGYGPMGTGHYRLRTKIYLYDQGGLGSDYNNRDFVKVGIGDDNNCFSDISQTFSPAAGDNDGEGTDDDENKYLTNGGSFDPFSNPKDLSNGLDRYMYIPQTFFSNRKYYQKESEAIGDTYSESWAISGSDNEGYTIKMTIKTADTEGKKIELTNYGFQLVSIDGVKSDGKYDDLLDPIFVIKPVVKEAEYDDGTKYLVPTEEIEYVPITNYQQLLGETYYSREKTDTSTLEGYNFELKTKYLRKKGRFYMPRDFDPINNHFTHAVFVDLLSEKARSALGYSDPETKGNDKFVYYEIPLNGSEDDDPDDTTDYGTLSDYFNSKKKQETLNGKIINGQLYTDVIKFGDLGGFPWGTAFFCTYNFEDKTVFQWSGLQPGIVINYSSQYNFIYSEIPGQYLRYDYYGKRVKTQYTIHDRNKTPSTDPNFNSQDVTFSQGSYYDTYGLEGDDTGEWDKNTKIGAREHLISRWVNSKINIPNYYENDIATESFKIIKSDAYLHSATRFAKATFDNNKLPILNPTPYFSEYRVSYSNFITCPWEKSQVTLYGLCPKKYKNTYFVFYDEADPHPLYQEDTYTDFSKEMNCKKITTAMHNRFWYSQATYTNFLTEGVYPNDDGKTFTFVNAWMTDITEGYSGIELKIKNFTNIPEEKCTTGFNTPCDSAIVAKVNSSNLNIIEHTNIFSQDDKSNDDYKTNKGVFPVLNGLYRKRNDKNKLTGFQALFMIETQCMIEGPEYYFSSSPDKLPPGFSQNYIGYKSRGLMISINNNGGTFKNYVVDESCGFFNYFDTQNEKRYPINARRAYDDDPEDLKKEVGYYWSFEEAFGPYEIGSKYTFGTQLAAKFSFTVPLGNDTAVFFMLAYDIDTWPAVEENDQPSYYKYAWEDDDLLTKQDGVFPENLPDANRYKFKSAFLPVSFKSDEPKVLQPFQNFQLIEAISPLVDKSKIYTSSSKLKNAGRKFAEDNEYDKTYEGITIPIDGNSTDLPQYEFDTKETITNTLKISNGVVRLIRWRKFTWRAPKLDKNGNQVKKNNKKVYIEHHDTIAQCAVHSNHNDFTWKSWTGGLVETGQKHILLRFFRDDTKTTTTSDDQNEYEILDGDIKVENIKIPKYMYDEKKKKVYDIIDIGMFDTIKAVKNNEKERDTYYACIPVLVDWRDRENEEYRHYWLSMTRTFLACSTDATNWLISGDIGYNFYCHTSCGETKGKGKKK